MGFAIGRIDAYSDNIVLGWKVTNGLDPRYWLGPKPAPGKQLANDLVTTDPATIAYHTVLVAQSGSRKFVFSGAYIGRNCFEDKMQSAYIRSNRRFPPDR
jgi:hypothetical protein